MVDSSARLPFYPDGELHFLDAIHWTANHLQFQAERNGGIEPDAYPDCLALINSIEELTRVIALWGRNTHNEAEFSEKIRRIHRACFVIKERHKNCA